MIANDVLGEFSVKLSSFYHVFHFIRCALNDVGGFSISFLL